MILKKKAIIIDDVSASIEVLSYYLEKYCNEIELIGTAQDMDSGLDLVNTLRPDIVFLDIKINNESGFDLLEYVGYNSFQVIFISAYDQYAIQSIQYDPIGYLLKPFSISELKKVVKRAIDKSKENTRPKEIINDFITITVGKEICFVKLNDIIYCQSNGNYTNFYLVKDEKIMTINSIGIYEDKLKNNGIFIRTHNQYIVNINYIKKVSKSDGVYIVLSNKKTIPVSRRKREEVLKLVR